MNKIETEINLICPKCKSELKFGDNLISCNSCNKAYEYFENVPVLLPDKTGTDMDYIDHYITDAEEFDYFEERDCPATADDERRLRQYIQSYVPDGKKLILDVGCGSAWAAKSFIPKGHKVVSFDISPVNTSKALEIVKNDNHYAVAGDALNPPFPGKSFDIIIAAEIIEHTVDPENFALSLFNLLKPGGRLIISTPYKEKIIYSLCVHCNKPTPRNAHLHSFDESRMEKLIDGSNAKIIIKSFGNKALLMLRMYRLSAWAPFSIWKAWDALASKVINKKEHLIAVYDRKD